jgi:NTP pyrophosphatase (non-canonical NTP hydrolase)
MKTRREMAEYEITTDPIFLFRRGRITYLSSDDPEYYYCSDCEGTFHEEEDEHLARHNDSDVVLEPMTDEELVIAGLAEHHWDVTTVFFSREEGESWGKARAYNFPDGWNVYAVPATGYMSRILNIRPEVLQFALEMEEQLREHDNRPGWKEECPMYLLDRLREEVQELVEVAITGEAGQPKLVTAEAADVANFCMMIADRWGGLA